MNINDSEERSIAELPAPTQTSLPVRIILLLVLLSFLTGLGGGYLVWGRVQSDLVVDEDSAEHTHEDPMVALVRQINPPEGFALEVSYGDLGPRLLAAGAINYDFFLQLYEQKGQALTQEQQAILTAGSQESIVFARQKGGNLHPLDLCPQGVEFGAHFTCNVFAFVSEFEIGLDVGELPCQALVRLDLRLHPLAIAEDSLRGFLILPEAGLGYFLLDGFEFAAALRGVKENSEFLLRESSVLRILFPILRSRLLPLDKG